MGDRECMFVETNMNDVSHQADLEMKTIQSEAENRKNKEIGQKIAELRVEIKHLAVSHAVKPLHLLSRSHTLTFTLALADPHLQTHTHNL